jgi:CRISPR-associated protein Cas2
MTVLIVERVKPAVRGDLSRWLLEPHPGVFVGHVNAMVRERLWQKACHACGDGGVILIWSTNTEQRFDMRMHGSPGREVVDFEGLKLVMQRE